MYVIIMGINRSNHALDDNMGVVGINFRPVIINHEKNHEINDMIKPQNESLLGRESNRVETPRIPKKHRDST